MSRLKDKYIQEAVPALKAKFNYANVMQVPKLEKIVINMGVGDARENARAIEVAAAELTKIAGQKAAVTTAKKSTKKGKKD